MSTQTEIIFHQIRNSTSILTYTGLKFLIDPYFSPKGYYPGFELCRIEEGKRTHTPLNDLPIPIEEIIKDIEAVLVTHTHADHWDSTLLNLFQNIFQFLSKIFQIKN